MSVQETRLAPVDCTQQPEDVDGNPDTHQRPVADNGSPAVTAWRFQRVRLSAISDT
jgi:hypothetical protein